MYLVSHLFNADGFCSIKNWAFSTSFYLKNYKAYCLLILWDETFLGKRNKLCKMSESKHSYILIDRGVKFLSNKEIFTNTFNLKSYREDWMYGDKQNLWTWCPYKCTCISKFWKLWQWIRGSVSQYQKGYCITAFTLSFEKKWKLILKLPVKFSLLLYG